MNRSKDVLKSCYTTCLDLALENSIRSLVRLLQLQCMASHIAAMQAFCCIATGIYGYPNEAAAEVALTVTREWLEKNADKVQLLT